MMQQMFLGQGPSGVSIDEVFSTDLYTGSGSPQSINNGIDLSGEGGLIWFKVRTPGSNHMWYDTDRGRASFIRSNINSAAVTGASSTQGLTSFNSNGFSLGYNWQSENFSGRPTVAYSFRQAQKFFNITTYTGNGATRSIAHGLGTQPGMVFIKAINGSGSWIIWHKEQYESSSPGTNRYFMFNTNAASNYGVVSYVDGTNVGVINNSTVNGNGTSYVMYSFAANEDKLIKTGIYTGNGNTQTINTGFQPQWLLIKCASSFTNWILVDSARGPTKIVNPNTSGSEYTNTYNVTSFTSNGFSLQSANDVNTNGSQYAYMAIAAP